MPTREFMAVVLLPVDAESEPTAIVTAAAVNRGAREVSERGARPDHGTLRLTVTPQACPFLQLTSVVLPA
jgi:hypothetical protein